MNEVPSSSSPPQPAKFDKLPLLLAATLTLFAMIATALLAVGNSQTKSEIELRLIEDLNEILSQVIPDDLHDNELTKDTIDISTSNGDVTKVYRARKGSELIAFAYSIQSNSGYAGPIKLVMGVNANGEVLGVRVLSHTETPGLGDKIELAKSNWILSFDGRSFNNLAPNLWGVKKDGGVFDQFSGATISPRNVVKTAKDGLTFFHDHKAELFKPQNKIEKQP